MHWGGTVNVLDETGAIVDGYVYYCNGLDPTKPPAKPVEVNGLQAGTTSSDQLWTDACQSLLDLYTSGYLDYDSNDTREELKIVFDKWVTYTIDISRLGTTCTE